MNGDQKDGFFAGEGGTGRRVIGVQQEALIRGLEILGASHRYHSRSQNKGARRNFDQNTEKKGREDAPREGGKGK